eukprot:25844_6
MDTGLVGRPTRPPPPLDVPSSSISSSTACAFGLRVLLRCLERSASAALVILISVTFTHVRCALHLRLRVFWERPLS